MSDNDYSDLGFQEPEVMSVKANLAAKIYVAIAAQSLTNDAAAKTLQLSRRKLRSLLDGNYEGFSVATLVEYLNRLGHDVEYVVKSPTEPSSGPGKVAVTAA